MKTPEMQTILDKIKEYDRVLIFRHKRPDGDATGSTKGLQRILKLTYPEKEILLQNCDFADYMAFLGGEDALLEDEKYADALAIVVDTGTMESLSDASDFVRMVESRQSIMISAPEEIAYIKGWISSDELLKAAERYGKSTYGAHLKKVAEGKILY